LSTASEAAAVVGIVVERSRRVVFWEKRGVQQVVGGGKIDAFTSGDGLRGWWECVVNGRCGVVRGLSGKVTMVMMTLSAFLRRKARRFSTGEFLVVLSVQAA